MTAVYARSRSIRVCQRQLDGFTCQIADQIKLWKMKHWRLRMRSRRNDGCHFCALELRNFRRG